MTSQVHEFDPREGGRFRVSLTYVHSDAAGKTTEHTDTYRGHFVRLARDEQVVEAIEFETADPSMSGEMIVTTTLRDSGDGTELTAVHDRLPPGLSPAANEIGWGEALDRLAEFLKK